MTKTIFQSLLEFSLACVCFVAMTEPSSADDWAKWLGPLGTNTWSESGVIETFPPGGPKVLWKTKIAGGYAGPAVSQGKVVITDFVTNANVKVGNFQRLKFNGTERVICLDEKTGNIVWKHDYPVEYSISYPSGPRCTPTIENDRVYVLGAEGHLFCFNLNDGSILWSKELKQEYKTESALWGYSAHPIIDGDKLITLAGGDGSHFVALNKYTGDEIWRSLTSIEQGYSSPAIINAGGSRQLITLRPDGVSSVNPETGKEYWTIPYQATSNSIIMKPLKIDDFLYVGGYSRQSLLIKLEPDQPTASVVWRDKSKSVPCPVNVQPYLDVKNNVAFGMDQNGDMRATKFPEAELLWATSKPVSERRTSNGTAFIVRQGDTDRYWLFNDSGELIIAKMTVSGYEEIDRVKVIEPTNNAFNRSVVWSMPAYANKRVYIRNDEEIICLDLAK